MRITSLPHDLAMQPLQSLKAKALEGQRPLGTAQRLSSQTARQGISVEVNGTHNQSPVDEARIASLRAAVADGSYQLQPLATAKALIAVKDLLELAP